MDDKLSLELPGNTMIHTLEDQLNYWSKEFGISKEELEETVKAGGTPTAAVEKFVKKSIFLEPA